MSQAEKGLPLASPLRPLLQADAYRYSPKLDFGSTLNSYIRHPGFRFTYHLRKTSFYSSKKRSFGLLPYIWHRLSLNHYRFRYGFDISPRTQIGPGLYIGHFGGVVVSPYAVIGANVNLAHGVTIGATSRGSRIGAPTLEDRVWIGVNAVIVGKITIGRESLIAPGAYVNFDVPPRSLVMGNPGKVVADSGSDGYVNNVLEDALPASP